MSFIASYLLMPAGSDQSDGGAAQKDALRNSKVRVNLYRSPLYELSTVQWSCANENCYL